MARCDVEKEGCRGKIKSRAWLSGLRNVRYWNASGQQRLIGRFVVKKVLGNLFMFFSALHEADLFGSWNFSPFGSTSRCFDGIKRLRGGFVQLQHGTPAPLLTQWVVMCCNPYMGAVHYGSKEVPRHLLKIRFNAMLVKFRLLSVPHRGCFVLGVALRKGRRGTL